MFLQRLRDFLLFDDFSIEYIVRKGISKTKSEFLCKLIVTFIYNISLTNKNEYEYRRPKINRLLKDEYEDE
jgi:hypothetical protein